KPIKAAIAIGVGGIPCFAVQEYRSVSPNSIKITGIGLGLGYQYPTLHEVQAMEQGCQCAKKNWITNFVKRRDLKLGDENGLY
ncbi:hypothetical protein Gorai_023165, partial [Gossypium raimondii]|nr:hypothetical protein [Gossypium raimondii]